MILLFGYWPPTDIGIPARHGMLWPWETLQQNYKGSGYDVWAISPKFEASLGTYPYPDGTEDFWGKGTETLQVDYRKTSQDFWNIVATHRPIAIMSFSRGAFNKSWELEQWGKNHAQTTWLIKIEYKDGNGVKQDADWLPPHAGGGNADFSPYQGTGTIQGNPPDPTQASASTRENTLPLFAIRDAINAHFSSNEIAAFIDTSQQVAAGTFVSNYMAYHVAWYQSYSTATFGPSERCLVAGHTHVGGQVSVADAQVAIDIQLSELFDVLP